MYRPRRYPASYRPRAIRGRGAYYYKPSATFLRQARVMSGQGGYLSDKWKKYRKYVPRALGAAIGSVIPGVGAKAGYDLGSSVSKKLLGWGAYMEDQPTLSAGTPGTMIYKGNVPSMHSVGESGVRITHKEIIGVITSTTGFNLSTYEVNPGINSTFPWLSGIARNFQQYDINGLCFTFKPTCSDAISAATISAMGSVSMSSDQNVYAAPPTSTINMLQSQFAVSGKPSSELLMPVEQAKRYGGKMTNHLLVRTGAVPTGATRQFYDDNVMYVATDANGVAGVQLGQLFVSYDISFFNPVSLAPGSAIPTCRWGINGTINSFHSVFGDAAPTVVVDTIGVSTDNGDATVAPNEVLHLAVGNVGVYMVHYHIKTTLGLGNNWFGNWTVTNGTLLTPWQSGSAYNKTPWGLEPSSGMDMCILVNIPDPTLECTITCHSINQAVTDPLSADLVITQINPSGSI